MQKPTKFGSYIIIPLKAESFTVQDNCAALPFQIADSYLGFGCQHKNQHIG